MPDKRYIRTILPLRLEWEPCYCLPDTSLFDNGNAPQPAVGDRIEVPFSGKKIIPFCTSGGSGLGRSDQKLHQDVSGDVKWEKGVQINRPNEAEIRRLLEKAL